MKLQDLPGRLRRRLHSKLEQGERVMWLTRPRTSRMRPFRRPAWGVSVGMFLFASVAAISGAWHGWGRWLVLGAAAFGLLMLLSFLYTIGPARPIYAVTDRRAVLLMFGLGGGFFCWFPEDLGMRRARVRQDGSGDIIFGVEFDHVQVYHDRRPTEDVAVPRFQSGWYGLPDVAEAQTYLSALQLSGHSPGEK